MNPHSTIPVKPSYKEGASVLGEVDQHGLGNIQAAKSCEVMGDLFPCAHVNICLLYTSCTAFGGTLFELLDWETDFKFRAYGRLLQNEGDSVFLFDLSEPEIFIQSYLMTGTDSPISGNGELSPLSVSGKRVRAVPKKLADRFGSDFYSHRLTSSSPELQSEDAWKLWLEGQLFETGEKLQVTKFDEMQRFIAEQLAPIKQKEEVDFNA